MGNAFTQNPFYDLRLDCTSASGITGAGLEGEYEQHCLGRETNVALEPGEGRMHTAIC